MYISWRREIPVRDAQEKSFMNPKITFSRVTRALKKDNGTGFCKACGKSQTYCEPDARNYPCNSCKKTEVFGAEELLFELA